MTGFDFDVIERSLPYLFREGMVFTLTLTALAMTGGIIFGTLLVVAWRNAGWIGLDRWFIPWTHRRFFARGEAAPPANAAAAAAPPASETPPPGA